MNNKETKHVETNNQFTTRKPDFLIIGAMKAGTTSIYKDLSTHSLVYLPEQKEPETLVKFGDNYKKIADDYKSLFKFAKPHQFVGEASTSYSKLPLFPNTAKRALDLCGPKLKIIYIKRDPIQRIISHFKHDISWGAVKPDDDINEVIFSNPEYINISNYSYQLEPWLNHFEQENILVVDFENYIKNKNMVIGDILLHIGIEDDFQVALSKPQNKSDYKPVISTLRGKFLVTPILRTKFFQRHIKRLIPDSIRKKITLFILPNTGNLSEKIILSDDSKRKLEEHFQQLKIEMS